MKGNKEKQIKLLPSHYYMDGTRLVFTEQYHLDRGYCCGNNCKHCIFEPKAQKGNTTIKK
jgi:hypothetical protein